MQDELRIGFCPRLGIKPTDLEVNIVTFNCLVKAFLELGLILTSMRFGPITERTLASFYFGIIAWLTRTIPNHFDPEAKQPHSDYRNDVFL
jgi:hypothetical protein